MNKFKMDRTRREEPPKTPRPDIIPPPQKIKSKDTKLIKIKDLALDIYFNLNGNENFKVWEHTDEDKKQLRTIETTIKQMFVDFKVPHEVDDIDY